MRELTTQIGNEFRPMRIVHGFNYDVHAPEEIALEQIKEQLLHIQCIGYGGVVLNVNFYEYLKNEHCWQMLEKAVALCKAMGLRVWIYDEKGYPSGGAGTIVLDDHPEYEALGLICLSEDCLPSKHIVIPKPVGHEDILAVFAIPGHRITDKALSRRVDLAAFLKPNGTLVWDADFVGRVFYIVTKRVFEGAHPARNYHEVRRYADVLNKDAMAYFIQVTYQPYYDRLSDYFGNTIEAFFTDEPSILNFYCPPLPVKVNTAHAPNDEMPLYPFITWSRDFRQTYSELFNEDPVFVAPYLFEGNSERAKQVRCRWYEVITRMYEEAFFKPISEFCASHGVAFSGHLLMEESIAGQAMAEGDFFRQLKYMQYPGIDILTSLPEDMPNEVLCCKTISSISHLNGRKHVMSESSQHTQRMSGTQVNKAQMIGAIAAQYAMGIDTITSYYGDNDLPVDEYRTWSDTISRINETMAPGQHSAPIAVYYPIHTVWSETEPSDIDFRFFLFLNDHGPTHGATKTMLDCCRSFRDIARGLQTRQLDFDFIADDGLLNSRVENGELVTPAGERFRRLVIPFTRVLQPAVVKQLSAFASKGLPVLVHKAGSIIGAFDSKKEAEKQYRSMLSLPSVQCFDEISAMLDSMKNLRDVVTADQHPGLMYLRKHSVDADRYLLVNAGKDPLNAAFSFAHAPGSSATVIDPETMTCKSFTADQSVDLSFAPGQPLLVLFEK